MSTKGSSYNLGEVNGPTRLPEVEGLVNTPCQYSVDETVERLKKVLQANGVRLFLLMDHSGEAKKAGMEMLPTKLLVFGSATVGTPLMLAPQALPSICP